MENNFDPNGVGIANGNLFGFPVAENDANIVVIPVPGTKYQVIKRR